MLARPPNDGKLNNMARNSIPALKAGEVAVVARITTTQGAAKRLADMGFVRGALVEMVRPGAPCIVRIEQTCFGLGRGHQSCIELSSF